MLDVRLPSISELIFSVGRLCLITSLLYVIFAAARFVARRRPGDEIMPVPPSALSLALSRWWPPAGWPMHPTSHFIPHERSGKTVIPLVWPLTGARQIYVADAAAIKRIFNDRFTWVRDTQNYELMAFFGPNIVTTEGDQWLRHRTVARQSFGERNNAFLWTETVSILEGWFGEWDTQSSATSGCMQTVVNVTDAMRDITLSIIASAGFGIRFEKRTTREEHSVKDFPETGQAQMPFSEALFVALETMIIKLFTPRIFFMLPIKTLRHSDAAYTELKRYIQELIQDARSGKSDTRESAESADLFRCLVDANNEGAVNAKGRLTDDELVSNIYTFFVAGHETTAHTLAFALALLAIHPEAQECIFRETSALWSDLKDETWQAAAYTDFGGLEYTLATFRETLRLFPAVVRIVRSAAKDTVLPCQIKNKMTGVWERSETVIEKGVEAMINIHGLHMSQQYWGEDVGAFRPDRFIDTGDYEWPRDAWVPFTAGPHVCVGQRFAIVEGVCILARLVRRYHIRPSAEISALTRDEQWKILTAWTPGLTSTPGRIDLVFEHRRA